jgi:hypothetical protein
MYIWWGTFTMQELRVVALLALALVLPLRSLAAQEVLRTDRLPVGLDVTAVADGGRYLTRADGRVWEVEISDRATTGSWSAGDFVSLRRISAPRGDYGWLLLRRGELDQQAAVRLVGRHARASGTSR